MGDSYVDPDRIGPDMDTPRRPFMDRVKGMPARIVKNLTTKEGIVGDYDYAFLFKPNLPFMKKTRQAAPFFGLNDKMPLLLAMLLGFQHALAMLAGVITPPIILSGSGGANLEAQSSYLVSTSLIVCGILSSIQITRFHIYKTRYYIGTGLISVVGTSFATIPVALGGLAQMYNNGYCPVDAAGNKLPCPRGYGAILGTAALCSLLEIGLSFAPAKVLKRFFPPLVTGPTVMLIGVNLITSGFEGWAGGSGSCLGRPTSGDYMLCPSNDAPMGKSSQKHVAVSPHPRRDDMSTRYKFPMLTMISRSLGKCSIYRSRFPSLRHDHPDRKIRRTNYEVLCGRHRFTCWLHCCSCLWLLLTFRNQRRSSRKLHMGSHLPTRYLCANDTTIPGRLPRPHDGSYW